MQALLALAEAQQSSEPEEDANLRAIVLVGVTGDGKSSTGNTLCGASDAFAVSGGLSSETAGVAHRDYLLIAEEVVEMRVVDTIGLHDTGLPAEEVMRRFSAFSDLTPSGIDVFLFVVRWGRFRPDHEAAVDAFVANCGESALAHTAHILPLVYTPTVGLACQRWSRLLLPVRGLYISLADAGRVEAILHGLPIGRGRARGGARRQRS